MAKERSGIVQRVSRRSILTGAALATASICAVPRSAASQEASLPATAAPSQPDENACLRMERDHPGARPSAHCRAHNVYQSSTFSVFVEQDWLQSIGNKTDRNYTMGLGFGRSGSALTEWKDQSLLWGAERTVDWLNDHVIRPFSFNTLTRSPLRRLDLESIRNRRAFSSMLSGTAFSPKDLREPLPIVGDRPYAFLLGWTTSRTSANVQADVAYASELTVGMIGSRTGRNVQRFIHKELRRGGGTSPDPKGWGNQIHDVPSVIFGIPTVRYGFTRSQLHVKRGPWFGAAEAASPMSFDLASDLAGEIGYYTSGSAGLRARLGLFSTPFWAWKQDPLTAGSRALGGETATRCINLWLTCVDGFAYGGVRGRVTGYNAMLTGYPGYDGYHIPWSDMNLLTYEVSAGAALTFWTSKRQTKGLQATYEALAKRSPEYQGAFKRPHAWGGVFATWVW